MPVSKTNPPQVPPSSVSIGKKPMNYPPTQLPTTQQQQQPKSARAAAKAPAYNTQHQQQQQQQSNRQTSPPNSNASSANKGRAGVGGNVGSNGPTSSHKGKASANKIWSTSTTEERERIKEFWLGLGEQERRNLVQIEKDTVLRKMKEQQKHSCSCAVCGRKRNAIEEELEVLYDAYYEELEQYANYQQRYLNSGGASTPPPGPGPFPGSVELDKNGAVVSPVPVPTSKRSPRPKVQTRPIQQNGKKQPQQRTRPHPQHHPPGKDSEFDDDGEEDEEYEAEEFEEEEDDEEDELDEDEDEDEEEDDDDVHPRPPVPNGRGAKPGSRPAAGRRNPTARSTDVRDGVLNIGNSVTVTGPGNILTVADDLLKNDGQKFLEMMEQLAERRLQREEEAAADVEDESDEDLDEDRDGSEVDEDGDDGAVSEEEDDEDDEDDDEEAMTEEQKMEEGKRMFSIFAARMFEQRVLQAYREKVAQERQLQLLRELDEEDKTTRDREAKKQSQNQKKKDKKRQQKLAKEEERAAREAEKAAEEAKTKARQAAIEEDNRKKREDERLKREAAKRAADEEKARKEEEKRKRLQKEREQELERDRKKKEREERMKKEREERERKSKEERARVAKEREEKAERDRIEKEKKAEKERQEREKLRLKREKEEHEREEREKERLSAQKAAAVAQPKTPIRLNATASSSTSSLSTSKSNPPVLSPSLQRTPNSSGGSVVNGIASGSKKTFNGKSVLPSTNSPGIVGQPSRSQSQGSQPHQTPNLSRPPHIPQTPVSISPHLPQQSGMMYGAPPVGQVPVILPPSLSPRVNTFPPMHYPYSNSNMQHAPGTPIVPPANTQAFNPGPSSFDPAVSFNRVPIPPIGVPISRGGSGGLSSSSNPQTPIGPPKGKTLLTSTSTPGQQMFSSGRRASLGPGGPGPITRPMAPIARPGTTTTDGTTSSGSGSPSHRSPSPNGILGSSALAADDDEVVPKAAGRRLPTTTPIGAGVPMTPLQSWGPASPRTALNPWPSQGGNNFSPSPSRTVPNGPVGSNTNGSLHIQVGGPPGGPIPPTGVESLWTNMPASPNDAWHPQSAGAFFHGPNQYMIQNHHSAATSAPHAGS